MAESFALGHPVQLGLAEGHVRRGDAPDAVHIAQGDVPRDAVGVELDAAPAPRADGGQRKIAPKRRAVLGGHGGRLIVVVVVVVVLVRVRLRLRARFERVLVRAPQARVVGRSDARRGLDASRRPRNDEGKGGDRGWGHAARARVFRARLARDGVAHALAAAGARVVAASAEDMAGAMMRQARRGM